MINYGTKFAGLGTGTFPNFAAKNASGPTATDGFPFTADSVNDWIGFTQALLNLAGITPNGQAEVAGSSQLIEAFIRGAAQRPGDIVFTAMPTQAQRAQHRLLDLAGQILPNSGDYTRLIANVYCGDAANPSAPAFYKCDGSGNRNASGAYLKIPDCRGIFLRGAGQNGTYTMANDTPYDGNAIGTFLGDAIQWFDLRAYNENPGAPDISELTFVAGSTKGYDGNLHIHIIPNGYAATELRWALETRPASISAYLCIKY
jgi:hypothetical protein